MCMVLYWLVVGWVWEGFSWLVWIVEEKRYSCEYSCRHVEISSAVAFATFFYGYKIVSISTLELLY